MKTKIILILSFILITNKSYSQIIPNPIDSTEKTVTVGEIKLFGAYYADCKMRIKKGDTLVTIFFKNVKYTTITDIKTITFKETGQDLNKLFQIISTNISSNEKKEITIPIQEGTLKLIFEKKSVQFTTWDNSILSYSIYFKQKHINQLFGKVE